MYMYKYMYTHKHTLTYIVIYIYNCLIKTQVSSCCSAETPKTIQEFVITPGFLPKVKG